jgi:hypothetical protein
VCFSPSLCRSNKGCYSSFWQQACCIWRSCVKGMFSKCLSIARFIAWTVRDMLSCIISVAVFKNQLWMSGFDFQYTKNCSLFKNKYYFQKSSWATERVPQRVACSLWPVCLCRSALMYVIALTGILWSHSFVEYLFHQCGKFIRDSMTEFEATCDATLPTRS